MKKNKTRGRERDIDIQIAALEKKLRTLKKKKVKVHNTQSVAVAERFARRLIKDATPSELKFMEIAKKKGLNLEFQYPIYIKYQNEVVKFFIADFCDIKNKIIFEIDGGYHFDSDERMKYDSYRDNQLHKQGYKVYRIANWDVMSGKSTALLYKAYKDIYPRFKVNGSITSI